MYVRLIRIYEGWRKLLCNVYFSTFITLVFGFILTKIGYANIWPTVTLWMQASVT